MNRLLLILLSVVVASCSRSLSRDELMGAYEIRLGQLRQEVRISANGKYVNAFYRDNLLVWSDQGAWTYDESGGQKGITFDRFRFGVPDASPGQGYWFVVPEKSFTGTKRLCFDPDLDRCFES